MKVSATRSRFNGRTCWAVLAAAVALTALLGGFAQAADISVHSSGRYYQDATGKPMFLIGYYGWAAVPDGYYIDHPSRYSQMITQGGPYKINYIRMSLSGNRLTGTSSPPSYNGVPTPVVFKYVDIGGGTYKADLNQWDPVFWDGLKAQCQLAKNNEVSVHVAIFDGVGLRDQSGACYGYNCSMWNPANHAATYYPAGNYGDCGSCFYRTADFNANTGIGKYQRLLIDKVTSELSGPNYDNVFFEVGNELLSSDSAWNTAVINYIKSKTSKPVSQCGGGQATNLQGLSQHAANSIAELKTNVAALVGHGYPAWEDPDGSYIYQLGPDDHRRAAWVSFAGGAPCWGGFTADFWTWPINPPPGFNTLKATYYKNLQLFIENSGVKFWDMVPQHGLVSNSGVNSCIAKTGVEYVAYVLNDATATLDLAAASGSLYCKLYDPKAGTWSGQQVVAGGGVRNFSKPAGADDWVIYATIWAPAAQTIDVKAAGAITVDGNTSDWNLSQFTAPVRGGQTGVGDYALVGYDGGSLYYGGYNTSVVLPTNAADHTAKVYSRHDATYQYFLVRCDDDDIRYSYGQTDNWQNDCVEFYIDPSHNHGSNPLSSSISDIQLVIDARSPVQGVTQTPQKYIYMCTDTYRDLVLAGVTAAVVRDATGWWLEVRIQKSALDPDMPAGGTFGVDFNFRDNDNNNDPTKTTVYCWSDNSTGAGFPSKIPDKWGNAFSIDPSQTPYPGPDPAAVPGVVQAEKYDNGGEGLGYHDASSGNSGGQYRSNDVDIEVCTDTGGGYNVGWMESGEWLAYTINIATTRTYDLKARVAAAGTGGTYHFELDGQTLTGSKAVPNTGGNQTWNTVSNTGVSLPAGQHILKLIVDAGGWNLNYIDIQNTSSSAAWNTLGTTSSLGSGQKPVIATDSSGNIHVVYVEGSNIRYKKYDSSMAPLLSELITTPMGAYWMDIKCDSNGVPHIAFSESVSNPEAPWTFYTFYTNRMGGTWKTPFQVGYDSGFFDGDDINAYLTSIGLYGNYAYIGTVYTIKHGKIVRLSNLSSPTPTVGPTVITGERSTIAVNGAGQVFAVGRIPGDAKFEAYNADLGMIIGQSDIFNGYAGAPHFACAGSNNSVHFIGWEVQAGGAYPCNDICGMAYARYHDGVLSPSDVRGLMSGQAGTGPAGGEVSGFWNDDVAPAIAEDTMGRVYVAWRIWNSTADGRITKVDDSGFTQTCVANPTCGTSICTGTQFTTSLPRRRWYNCDLAPSSNGGVYVVWESGGTCYIRGVGIGSGGDDTTPPGPVIGFHAEPGNDKITLSWTNPDDVDFEGTMIRYSTTGYPTNQNDGALLVIKPNTPGSTDSYVHNGLSAEQIYYYKAFAYDAKPNYDTTSLGQSARPIHLILIPMYASNFDANAEGWNLSIWYQGGVQPTMGWVSDGGCSGGGIQCVGAGATDSTGAGLREGGEMWKVFSTESNGEYESIQNIRVYFDVKVNGLGNDYTGVTGGGDHNLLEEQLTTYYSTDGGANWTDAGYIGRAILSGLQTCGTRFVDLSDYPACNNNPNFAIKFRWQVNTGPESGSGADIANIDNVVIRGTGTIPDIWAPDPVTNFTAVQTDNGELTLSWTNPIDSDFTGTMIRWKAGSAPTSATDGMLVVDKAGTPGSLANHVHSGLTNGQTYYYSAFAHDARPNYSVVTSTSGTPVTIPAPGPVTSFKTYGGNQKIDLAWTNPTSPSPMGIRILCKAGSGFPISPTDPSATVVYDALGTSYNHTGLNNGTKYYFAAYAYTTPTAFSTAAQSSTYAAAEVTIPTMKGLANSVIRSVKGNVVTAVFTGYFYMQDPLSPYGIKVSTTETPLPSIGQKVDVLGSMTGMAGNERSLSCTGNWIRVTDPGPITIVPAALNNKAVGGANLNDKTPGVVGGTGANNVGLLVRVSGKVTQTQAGQYFYVDDGCGLKDGTKTGTIDNVGVRIKVTTIPSGVVAGKYVVVTGIVSPLSASGLRPQILPLPQPAGVQVVGT